MAVAQSLLGALSVRPATSDPWTSKVHDPKRHTLNKDRRAGDFCRFWPLGVERQNVLFSDSVMQNNTD